MFKFISKLLKKSAGSPKDKAATKNEQTKPLVEDGADVPENAPEIKTEPVSAASQPAPVISSQTYAPKYLWCLDNGHGKATPGKRSPVLDDGRQLLEYELVRDVNRRIMEKLDAVGVQYFNVVPETEGDVPLSERCRRANEKSGALPKIYVSIHANAFGNGNEWTSPAGIETWYHKNSAKGKKVAEVFQCKLNEQLGWQNRGLKFHDDPANAFYVLRHTSMPAVLTENGFYTNKEECKKLLDGAFRQKIADAHVAAILETEAKASL